MQHLGHQLGPHEGSENTLPARTATQILEPESKHQSQGGRNIRRPKSALLKRDYAAEEKAALDNQIDRVSKLAQDRNDQSLGEEYIKLAQAMILCTLPHGPTKDRQVVRRARLGDGSTISVTFTAAAASIAMPYGADRKLLFWLIDRALRTNSPFVPWSSAAEYQKELGLQMGGRQNQQLRERFLRLSGLVVNIERKGSASTGLQTFPVIERSFLPNSLSTREQQTSLPDLSDRFGILLHAPLFADMKKHNSVMPRRMWLEIKGPTAVQDIIFWLFWRCYSAASDTIIPWAAFADQFPQDSNRRRMKQYIRQAVLILRTLWPQVNLAEVPQGLQIGRAAAPMLDDDPTLHRERRL